VIEALTVYSRMYVNSSSIFQRMEREENKE